MFSPILLQLRHAGPGCVDRFSDRVHSGGLHVTACMLLCSERCLLSVRFNKMWQWWLHLHWADQSNRTHCCSEQPWGQKQQDHVFSFPLRSNFFIILLIVNWRHQSLHNHAYLKFFTHAKNKRYFYIFYSPGKKGEISRFLMYSPQVDWDTLASKAWMKN